MHGIVVDDYYRYRYEDQYNGSEITDASAGRESAVFAVVPERPPRLNQDATCPLERPNLSLKERCLSRSRKS